MRAGGRRRRQRCLRAPFGAPLTLQNSPHSGVLGRPQSACLSPGTTRPNASRRRRSGLLGAAGRGAWGPRRPQASTLGAEEAGPWTFRHGRREAWSAVSRLPPRAPGRSGLVAAQGTRSHRPASAAGPGEGGWGAGRGARIGFPLAVRAARAAAPLAGSAGAGPLGPGAAAPARRAARSFWRPPKMTICHSIKVSGQLMGEPGSATPGQNGLLPGIGEVQMLNAEHCALSPSRPPPGRRSGRWTAAG